MKKYRLEIVYMTPEDQEFTDFMTEASIKAMELRQKYDNLSENNKRRFLMYIEPMVRTGGTQAFMNQMNILFNTGKR